jgi:hypothetical protein
VIQYYGIKKSLPAKKKTFVCIDHIVILLISQVRKKLAGISTFSMKNPLKVAEVSSGRSLNLS